MWLVTFNVIIVTILGNSELCPCKTVNLIHKCCARPDLPFFTLPPSWRASLIRGNNIETMNTTPPLSVQEEFRFFTLNQNLEKIKLNEKST